MSDEIGDKIACPIGQEFLNFVSEQEDACEAESRERLPKLGKKAPACMEKFGTVLSLFDRAASCFWGCRGGDHVIEYLAGRAYSCARASLRLLLFGFYDESLSMTRSIGEIANLLFLFKQDPNALPHWLASDKQKRRTQFAPVKVRKRLDELGSPILIDEIRYGELCEVASHPTPQTKPQAHNVLGVPVIGATFQDAGAIMALNELAIATAFAFLSLPKLLAYPDERTKEIHQACRALVEASGGLNILTVKEAFMQIRDGATGTETEK